MGTRLSAGGWLGLPGHRGLAVAGPTVRPRFRWSRAFPLGKGESTGGIRARDSTASHLLAVTCRNSALALSEEETQSVLRTWGGQHAGLWPALLAAGRAVEVVVVAPNAERLAAAGRVLDGWASTPAAVDAHPDAAARVAEQVRRDEEIASVRAAIATLDEAALVAYGGLNGAVARCAALETAGDGDQSGEADDLCRTDVAVSEGAGMSPLLDYPARALASQPECANRRSHRPGTMDRPVRRLDGAGGAKNRRYNCRRWSWRQQGSDETVNGSKPFRVGRAWVYRPRPRAPDVGSGMIDAHDDGDRDAAIMGDTPLALYGESRTPLPARTPQTRRPKVCR